MKKIRFLNALVVAVLASILLNACFKPTYDYQYISQEIKDYCMFEEGSYWIYQDSVTSNIDSVILTKTSYKYQEYEKELNHHIVTECYKGDYYHYLSDTSIFPYDLFNNELYFPIVVFNHRIQDCEKNIILRVSAIGESSYLLSYLIEENIFNDVKVQWEKNCFRVIRDGISDFYHGKFYWAENIGLIRYEIYNSNNEIVNTYNLIKYNVKPYKQ